MNDTIDTLRAQLAEAQREAVTLAQYLYNACYSHEPDYASGKVKWEPCDTPAGVITQIDNMVAGVRAQLAEAQAALKTVMRNAELSKEPCGSDPESPVAIRNAKFASLASVAAQGLGMVSGPSLTENLVEYGYEYIDAAKGERDATN